VILTSDALIPLLFGAEFTTSAPVARVLALGVWAFGLSLVAGAALKGLGQPGVAALSQLAGLMVTFGLIVSVSGGNLVNVAYAAVGGFLVSLTIEGVALAAHFRSNSPKQPSAHDKSVRP
jgi:O-antigen/teichoic acid export membrane protein